MTLTFSTKTRFLAHALYSSCFGLICPSTATYIDEKSTANAVMFVLGWASSGTFQLPVPEFMTFIRSRFRHSNQKKAGWPLFQTERYKLDNRWIHIHGEDKKTKTSSKQKDSKKKKGLSFKVDPETTQLFGNRNCYISITEIIEVKYGDCHWKKGILVKMSGGNKMPFAAVFVFVWARRH